MAKLCLVADSQMMACLYLNLALRALMETGRPEEISWLLYRFNALSNQAQHAITVLFHVCIHNRHTNTQHDVGHPRDEH